MKIQVIKQQVIAFSLAIISMFAFSACSGDDDNNQLPDNDEEEITRVVIKVSNGTTVNNYQFNSLTNDGADEIMLSANTTYTVEAEFWNDEESPAENVTEEILQEADEHLVCFEPTGIGSLTILATDQDSNGLEIGLQSSWQAGVAGSGSVLVKLKHQPDLKNTLSQVNCSLGESDVEVTFPVRIE